MKELLETRLTARAIATPINHILLGRAGKNTRYEDMTGAEPIPSSP
ncbi:MAG: hypothetical protein HC919_05120 [Oscillatoriales cyanobacterium SM2_2_1]|nr:hypothetical protein [Oscillatoriales cyanobacterium SM2_2_1]